MVEAEKVYDVEVELVFGSSGELRRRQVVVVAPAQDCPTTTTTEPPTTTMTEAEGTTTVVVGWVLALGVAMASCAGVVGWSYVVSDGGGFAGGALSVRLLSRGNVVD